MAINRYLLECATNDGNNYGAGPLQVIVPSIGTWSLSRTGRAATSYQSNMGNAVDTLNAWKLQVNGQHFTAYFNASSIAIVILAVLSDTDAAGFKIGGSDTGWNNTANWAKTIVEANFPIAAAGATPAQVNASIVAAYKAARLVI